MTDEQITELKNFVTSKSMPITKIAKKFNITRQSVYNYAT
ncbi:MAG: helix-turn-helix domain-containing protein [Alphaproteobacteria bacterium]|nr:helix-turn-helix domain-containing protein [Alphaproteobacteria bacterium]